MNTLDKAKEHAASGLRVFFCHEKAPASPRGFRDATADAASLEALHRRYGGKRIAILTGQVNGIDVLDIDLKGDVAMTAGRWLVDNHARLPSTYTVETQSGGLHLYFQHQHGVRNSASRIARGVDVRGEGGYVIHWPDAGFTVVNLAPPAPWPDWLIEAMRKRSAYLPPAKPPVFPTGDAARRYALAALQDGAKKVAATQEGGRNDALNREAFALARFLPSGAITKEELTSELVAAAINAGMEDGEIVATIASAVRARVAA